MPYLDSLFPASSLQPEPLPPVGYRGKTHCLLCSNKFTNENVYSKMGWRETQISGFCELCFDKVCKDLD